MIYTCHCCGKKFKTESGFKKHFCKYMQRFVEVDTGNYYVPWCVFKTIYGLKISKDLTKEYYSLLHFSNYDDIIRFFKWSREFNIQMYEYLQYLKSRNILIKDWMNDNIYKQFLEYFLANESPALAYERSEKHLKSLGLTLNELTPTRLYFSLLSGDISNKYLRHMNCDVRTILDQGQLKDLEGFLV